MISRKVLCNVMFLFAATASAAEVHYSAGTSMMHATNINHQNTPADNELVQTLRGRVSVIENTANLDMNVDATLESSRYTNDQAADITTGRLVGNVLLTIKPGMLEWFTSDIYTQTAIDPLSSNTPNNRQNANAFTTGPNYYMRLSRRSNLELESRLENYSYDIADTDNNRMFGASRLEYAFSSSITSNVNYESSHVMYDNDELNSDYSRNDVFIGLGYQRGVNTAELHGGYSIISNDTRADIKESRYLLALQNRRTRTTTVRAEYSRNISDTSSDIRSVTTPGSTDTNLLSTSAELYIRTSTRLNITNALPSGVLTINAHKTDSDYLTADDQDQSESGVSISNLWVLHGGSSFTIDGSYIQTTYINLVPDINLEPERINDDYIYGATYAYRIGRNINIDLRAEVVERQSTAPLLTYDDTRIILTLEYTSR
jgi:hypothetical protein